MVLCTGFGSKTLIGAAGLFAVCISLLRVEGEGCAFIFGSIFCAIYSG